MEPGTLVLLFMVAGIGMAFGASLRSARQDRTITELKLALDISSDRAVAADRNAEAAEQRAAIARNTPLRIYVDSRGRSPTPVFSMFNAQPEEDQPTLVLIPQPGNRASLYMRSRNDDGDLVWAALGDGFHRKIVLGAQGEYLGSQGFVPDPWYEGPMASTGIARLQDQWNAPITRATPDPDPLPPSARAPRVGTETRKLDFEP